MEQRLLSDLHRSFEHNSNTFPSTAKILSLITNPHTSESTLDFVLQNLIPHLKNPYSLSLLAVLGRRSRKIRQLIVSSVHQHFAEIPNLSLPRVLTLLDVFGDESLFLTIGFSTSEKNRRWLLRNVNLFHVKPSVLITVLVGFSRDPFPYVRESVLDGFVSVLRNNVVVEDLGLVECSYFRCVEMLFDVEKRVRCSAVRAVSEWGQLLQELSDETTGRAWSDALFVQLCLMVRDMEMEIRVAAFDSLEKIQTVSGDLLLQTLSKKAMLAMKDKFYPGKYTAKLDRIPATASAFAFGHGLEDEYHEVRRSACCALQKLSVLSAEFSGGAVHMLMGMLNDDTVVVRLLALESLSRIAMQGCLKLEESHLNMFVGTLFESDALVRSATRKVIQSIKFPKLVMFKKCVDSLVKNYEIYPEDEADIFSVLYNIGRSHGRYVTLIIQEIAQELEPSFDGNMGFNKRRTTALFVLAISSPVSLEQRKCSIEPQIFSYAVTILGQLSHALRNVMDQNTLLTYLSHCSRFTYAATTFFNEEVIDRLHLKGIDKQLQENDYATSGGVLVPEMMNLKKFISPFHDDRLNNAHVEAKNFAGTILHSVVDLWALILLGCINEVVPTLRSWKEELRSFAHCSSQNAGPLTFISKYLDVIKLLGKVWSFIFQRNLHSRSRLTVDALLGKTEMKLNEMLHSFTGLSREIKMHILEIMLVIYTMKLAYGGICYVDEYMKRVDNTLSIVKHLSKEGSMELSDFITALLNVSSKSEDDCIEKIDMFQKSLNVFSLKRLEFCEGIKYQSAELNVCGGIDFQNPLPFIYGLPVGIPFDITLHNAPRESRLWLKMSFGEESAEFLFLDLLEFEGCDELRKIKSVAAFFGTPNVKYFSMKVSVVMECSSEDRNVKKHYCCGGGGGPKCEYVRLCKEKDLYLINGC